MVAEIAMLRKLNVLHRKAPKHVAFTNVDRLVFAGLDARTTYAFAVARYPAERLVL